MVFYVQPFNVNSSGHTCSCFTWPSFNVSCSTLILVILVRLFQCSAQHNLSAHQRARTYSMFWFTVLSTYFLSACFNVPCSSQHNLCAHQRALVRTFIVREHYMTKFQWFMFTFTALSTLILVILVCLFQCLTQHNLNTHQRARTPRGFYSLPRLFSKLDSCPAFNSFISLSLKLIVLGLSSDSGPLPQSQPLIRFSAQNCKSLQTWRSTSIYCLFLYV